MGELSYEDLELLQDIVDEVYNGRTEGHKCPYCKKGTLEVEADEAHIRLECPSCGKYFDGRLA